MSPVWIALIAGLIWLAYIVMRLAQQGYSQKVQADALFAGLAFLVIIVFLLA